MLTKKSSNVPRPEYPRPDFERSEWLNLNGEWDFEFDDNEVGEIKKWYIEKEFSKKITVPFCFQSKLSGINDKRLREVFWYKRKFNLPQNFLNKRTMLNFGAVDYYAKIWVNGSFCGSHRGGYTPFKIDITENLNHGLNTIVVRVEDRFSTTQPRGKQYWREQPDRCWYTATSGIWQTVWLETVGNTYIEKIRLTPNIDDNIVHAQIFLNKDPGYIKIETKITFKPAPNFRIGSSELGLISKEKSFFAQTHVFDINDKITNITLNIQDVDDINDVHLWSPDTPNLYDLELTLIKDNEKVDNVKTYFGMRKISVEGDNILLNNRPYYQKLILDQGYWPDSLLTPPSDEAIRHDIEMTKQLGFNGARKHQKIEDPRYYYWADKLGILVWGEMPSAYKFSVEEIENVTEEWIEFINRDYNHPCIVTWVPLNESWGVREIFVNKEQQNFARSLYYLTKSMDPTRLVSTNDGWEMVKSDIVGVHDYSAWGEMFTPKYKNWDSLSKSGAVSKMLYCKGERYHGEPILITEYGGIAFETKEKGYWGYGEGVKNEEMFIRRYKSLMNAIRGIPYIRGYCYTQLTDVMQEVNGLMTEDRKFKADPLKLHI